MSDTLVVLDESETLADLAENMERFSLRHLPVVAGDRLVGLGDTIFGERVTDLAANPVSSSGERLAIRLAFHTGVERIVWT